LWGGGSGSEKRANNKSNLMKTKWLISIVLLTLFSLYWYKCQYGYYDEYNEVKGEFEKIKGVKIIKLGVGNYDIDLEEIYATIMVEDKIEIGFGSSIHPSSFHEESPVNIDRFGEWEFQEFLCTDAKISQDEWWKGSIDFGKNGSFNHHSTEKISNIKDAILNYQSIGLVVAKIPEYPDIGMIQHIGGFPKFFYKFKHTTAIRPEFKTVNCDSLKKVAIQW
jgi:hypothetical protein